MRYLAPVHTSSISLSSGEAFVDDTGHVTVDNDLLTQGDVAGLAANGFEVAADDEAESPAPAKAAAPQSKAEKE